MSSFPNGWLGLGVASAQNGLTEPTDPGYARVAIAFSALRPGAACQSTADVSFGPAVVQWPAATSMALFDAATGGDPWVTWSLASPITVPAGATRLLPAGSVQLRFVDASDLLVRGHVAFQPDNVVAVSADSLPVTVWSTAVLDVVAAWGSAAAGSTSLTTEPLLDAERTDVRRFCGYPAYGNGGADSFQNWRFFSTYGTLEYRLTNLAPAELVQVRAFLVDLRTLESTVPAAGDNLDTASAAIWTRNPNEVPDRFTLLARWSARLADFLGVPYAPTRAPRGAIII